MSTKKIIVVVGATGSQGGGLARAILNDPSGEFAVRAITRNVNSDKVKALAALGAEVVAADLDNPSTLQQAFEGAYGAYCVTFYWEHFSPAKELAQAKAMAEAAGKAHIQHLIWSSFEDTRKWIPLTDNRMPTLAEKYKVPHFDAKSDAERFFINEGIPTTFLLPTFYWDNLYMFGMGPQRGEDGILAFTLPMGKKKLAGIAAEDIGRCAYGVFKGGSKYFGKVVGVAGEHLTGAEMAATLSKAFNEEIRYNEVSADAYRSFGFPGAAEIGNMFQFYRDFDQIFLATRDLAVSKSLNPSLQNFETWLARNKDKIVIK